MHLTRTAEQVKETSLRRKNCRCRRRVRTKTDSLGRFTRQRLSETESRKASRIRCCQSHSCLQRLVSIPIHNVSLLITQVASSVIRRATGVASSLMLALALQIYSISFQFEQCENLTTSHVLKDHDSAIILVDYCQCQINFRTTSPTIPYAAYTSL